MKPTVTRAHGETFADSLIRQVWECAAHAEAFAATKLMKAPDAYLRDHAALDDHNVIVDEICEKAFAAVRQALSDAFVAAGTEVLAREEKEPVTMTPHVEMVDVVTREHAAKFAEDWYTHAINRSMTDPFDEAFGATGILTWPEGDDDEFTPAQRRFDAMQREIVETTCAVLKPAVAETFRMVATVILARERNR